VTHDFSQTVLARLSPSLIYLDAHPYNLLNNVISGWLDWSRSHAAIMAIHDCSPTLYFPHMWISKDDHTVVSTDTGLWERHVLSKIFNTPNDELDDVQTSTHKLRIFGTPYGLALITSMPLSTQSNTNTHDRGTV
jgi:hypothetical protein